MNGIHHTLRVGEEIQKGDEEQQIDQSWLPVDQLIGSHVSFLNRGNIRRPLLTPEITRFLLFPSGNTISRNSPQTGKSITPGSNLIKRNRK